MIGRTFGEQAALIKQGAELLEFVRQHGLMIVDIRALQLGLLIASGFSVQKARRLMSITDPEMHSISQELKRVGYIINWEDLNETETRTH